MLARSVEEFETGVVVCVRAVDPLAQGGILDTDQVNIKPAIRRGATHETDGVPLGIPSVINMLALDDVPDIPR